MSDNYQNFLPSALDHDLLSDPLMLAEVVEGRWFNLSSSECLDIKNIAYLEKNAHHNSLALVTSTKANFGFSPQKLEKYKGRFSALMGAYKAPPLEGLPYLRIGRGGTVMTPWFLHTLRC